jgi:cell division protein FtsB
MDGVATRSIRIEPTHPTGASTNRGEVVGAIYETVGRNPPGSNADGTTPTLDVAAPPRITRIVPHQDAPSGHDFEDQELDPPDARKPDRHESTTPNAEGASTDVGPTQTWHRRRPIILGQVIRVQATTDWKRIALIVAVLGFFGWILTGFLARSDDTQRIAKRLEGASREVAKQETKVEVLRTQVAYLATDAYIEVAAREKLGLVKPGDHPVIVLPEIDEVAWVPPAPPERPSGPFGPRYGRIDDWIRMFFGGADEGILGKT